MVLKSSYTSECQADAKHTLLCAIVDDFVLKHLYASKANRMTVTTMVKIPTAPPAIVVTENIMD